MQATKSHQHWICHTKALVLAFQKQRVCAGHPEGMYHLLKKQQIKANIIAIEQHSHRIYEWTLLWPSSHFTQHVTNKVKKKTQTTTYIIQYTTPPNEGPISAGVWEIQMQASLPASLPVEITSYKQ